MSGWCRATLVSRSMLLSRGQEQGLRGLNITHPYKERILRFVVIEDATVRAIGACNTLC